MCSSVDYTIGRFLFWSCFAFSLCVSSFLILAFGSPCLGKREELVFVLIVHILFVNCAYVHRCHFSLPLGVKGSLGLLLVALSGLFCVPFSAKSISGKTRI